MALEYLREEKCRVVFLATAIMFLISTAGCDRWPRVSDSDARLLSSLVDNPSLPPEAKERARLAMSRYESGRKDPEPILIAAALSRAVGSDQVHLGLTVFDAQQDLRGVVILEESHNPTGAPTALQEDYPFYHHFTLPGMVNFHLIPVSFRDSGQRKDEQRWADYLAKDFDASLKDAIDSGEIVVDPPSSPPSSPSWDTVWVAKCQFWEKTLPRVWVSVPEPNRVDVSVYVYDKAGHKSRPAKLLNYLADK